MAKTTTTGERLMRLETKVEAVETKIDYNHKEVLKVLDRLQCSFVTKVEFKPVQKLVYGGVGVVLTAVTLAAIYLII